MRFIGPGEMFGTVALFTHRRYPADADTLTNAIEVSWSEADLLKLIGRTTLYSERRLLTRWDKRGIVVTRDQYLTIAKLSGVKQIAKVSL